MDIDGQGGWGVLKIGQFSWKSYVHHPYMKLLRSSKIFKQRNNQEVSSDSYDINNLRFKIRNSHYGITAHSTGTSGTPPVCNMERCIAHMFVRNSKQFNPVYYLVSK